MREIAVNERVWRLSVASVRGKSHIDRNIVNQDAAEVITNASGDVVCAVVSDGAGTAARSDEGSRIASALIARELCAFGENCRDRITERGLRAQLESSVRRVHQQLQPLGDDLRQFRCTMVMWLWTPGTSFIAQIGDSAALSTKFGVIDGAGESVVDFFPPDGHRLHEVERGEYDNETFFLTDPGWERHLRISRVPDDAQAVVLMSDGAMEVATKRRHVFRGFLSNLVCSLIGTSSRAERNQTIHAWLSDPRTHPITGDDKTLLVAVQQSCTRFSTWSVFTGDQAPPTRRQAAGEEVQVEPRPRALMSTTPPTSQPREQAPTPPRPDSRKPGRAANDIGATQHRRGWLVPALLAVTFVQSLAIARMVYTQYAQPHAVAVEAPVVSSPVRPPAAPNDVASSGGRNAKPSKESGATSFTIDIEGQGAPCKASVTWRQGTILTIEQTGEEGAQGSCRPGDVLDARHRTCVIEWRDALRFRPPHQTSSRLENMMLVSALEAERPREPLKNVVRDAPKPAKKSTAPAPAPRPGSKPLALNNR